MDIDDLREEFDSLLCDFEELQMDVLGALEVAIDDFSTKLSELREKLGRLKLPTDASAEREDDDAKDDENADEVCKDVKTRHRSKAEAEAFFVEHAKYGWKREDYDIVRCTKVNTRHWHIVKRPAPVAPEQHPPHA
jgi:hypothetical protein